MWLLELLCTISVLLKAFLTTVMFIVLQWFFGEWKCKTINTHSKHTCQQEKWKSNFKTSKLQFQTAIFLQFHTLTLFSCYKTFHFEKERSKCFQHFLPQFKQINLLPCLKQKSPFNEKIHAWLSNQNAKIFFCCLSAIHFFIRAIFLSETGKDWKIRTMSRLK